MRRRCRGTIGQAGFTLIEMLIAAAILGVTLVAMTTAFPVSYVNVVYAGRVSQGVALAQLVLEDLKAGTFPPANGNATSGIYTITWTVTSVGVGGAADDLRKVSVTVTWPQMVRNGRYDLAGFISKPY